MHNIERHEYVLYSKHAIGIELLSGQIWYGIAATRSDI